MKKILFRISFGGLLLALILMFVTSIGGAAEFELKFAFHQPLKPHNARYYNQWAGAIERATDGRVKIVYFPSDTLGKGRDHYDLLVNGVADIVCNYHGYNPGRFPLSELMSLPFLGIKSGVMGTYVVNDLYAAFPEEFDKEFGEVKLLTLLTGSPYQLGSKKPIRSLKELKGMKTKVAGNVPTATGKALGAVPTALRITQTYESMDRGILDAYFQDFSGAGTFKLYETNDYFTVLNMYVSVHYYAMNKKTWDKLPKDIQEVFSYYSGLTGGLARTVTGFDVKDYAIQDMIAGTQGKEIIELDPKELEAFKMAVKPVHEEYVKKLEAKGLPGKKMYAELLRIVEKWSKR